MDKLMNAMAIINTMTEDEFSEIRRFQDGDGILRRLFRKKSKLFSECLKSHKHIELGRKGGEFNRARAKLVKDLIAAFEKLKEEKNMLENEKVMLVAEVNDLVGRLSRSEVENKELEDMIKVLKEKLRPKRKKKGGDDGGEGK